MTKGPIDMTGFRSGRLLVLGFAEKNGRQWNWLCQCDCGRQRRIQGSAIRTGRSNSCGCIAAEKSKARWANPSPEMRSEWSLRNTVHGMSTHPAYRAWIDMKIRCLSHSHKWYPSYGGRGIRVCDEWAQSFDAFWRDVGGGWFKGGQLGRKNNDGNYEPANVRWETREQQQNNRSCNVFVTTPDGVMTATQAARKYGISPSSILRRNRMGYSPQELVKPPQKQANQRSSV